jgi:hypothetical protein
MIYILTYYNQGWASELKYLLGKTSRSDPIFKNFEARNFRSDIQNLLGCPSLIITTLSI